MMMGFSVSMVRLGLHLGLMGFLAPLAGATIWAWVEFDLWQYRMPLADWGQALGEGGMAAVLILLLLWPLTLAAGALDYLGSYFCVQLEEFRTPLLWGGGTAIFGIGYGLFWAMLVGSQTLFIIVGAIVGFLCGLLLSRMGWFGSEFD